MSQPIDITGQRFGRLVALERDGVTKHDGALWRCACDCGAVAMVTAHSLRRKRGGAKSCGCLSKEASARSGAATATHGMSKTPVYAVWRTMHARCENPKNKSYADYGARGIRVCERWFKFENFFADMGPRPDGGTLERGNNDGDYEPGNCTWAPKAVQAKNTRRNIVITHGGRTQILTEWAAEVGISVVCLWKRLQRGWDFQRAISQPTRESKSKCST